MNTVLRAELDAALGGEYRLLDGRVFWMDAQAVQEILRRVSNVITKDAGPQFYERHFEE